MVDAGRFKPSFSPEIRETIDRFDKVANRSRFFQRSFFDEVDAQPFSPTKGPDFVTEVDTYEDESVGVAFVPAAIAAGKVLAPLIGKGIVAGTIAHLYTRAFGDEMDPDVVDPLTGENVQDGAFDELGDEEVGVGPAIPLAIVMGGGAAKATAMGVAAAKFIGQAIVIGGVAYGTKKLLGSSRDEMEPEANEAFAFTANPFRRKFLSNPETLAPIDFSSVVTDAYQQNAAISTIDGQLNQGADPF